MQTTRRTFAAFVAFIALVTLVTTVNGTSIDEVRTLRTNLLSGYDKYIRPVTNQTDVLTVDIALKMIALQEFDEVQEKFSFVGVIRIQWKDVRMMWSMSNYSGIETLVMGYRHVWLPEIILSNPSEKMDSLGDDWQLIRYGANGKAKWHPQTLFKATCPINAYYFPFDIQKCCVDVYAWGYSHREVMLNVGRDFVDISEMAEHGSWSVIKTQAKTATVGFSSRGYFIIWFERKPQYVIVNIILPVLFLCLLNVMVFLLPAESGERVSYSITVLLSIAVFMTIVSDTLPKTSEPLPIISYFLMISLIESAVIAIATMLNLRLYHKKNNEDIPDWLIRICQRLKKCCTRRRRKNSKQQTATEEGHSASLKSLILGSTNKVGILHVEPKLQEMTASFSDTPAVSWQDVSILVDYVLLVISASATLISFSVFMIITKAAPKIT